MVARFDSIRLFKFWWISIRFDWINSMISILMWFDYFDCSDSYTLEHIITHQGGKTWNNFFVRDRWIPKTKRNRLPELNPFAKKKESSLSTKESFVDRNQTTSIRHYNSNLFDILIFAPHLHNFLHNYFPDTIIDRIKTRTGARTEARKKKWPHPN